MPSDTGLRSSRRTRTSGSGAFCSVIRRRSFGCGLGTAPPRPLKRCCEGVPSRSKRSSPMSRNHFWVWPEGPTFAAASSARAAARICSASSPANSWRAEHLGQPVDRIQPGPDHFAGALAQAAQMPERLPPLGAGAAQPRPAPHMRYVAARAGRSPKRDCGGPRALVDRHHDELYSHVLPAIQKEIANSMDAILTPASQPVADTVAD